MFFNTDSLVREPVARTICLDDHLSSSSVVASMVSRIVRLHFVAESLRRAESSPKDMHAWLVALSHLRQLAKDVGDLPGDDARLLESIPADLSPTEQQLAAIVGDGKLSQFAVPEIGELFQNDERAAGISALLGQLSNVRGAYQRPVR